MTDEQFLKLLAAAVILVTVATVVAFIFLVTRRDRMQYRFVLILLFFSLTAMSSLLFTGTAELRANTTAFTIGVTGAGALWLISIYLFTRWYPEGTLFTTPAFDWETANGFGNLLRDLDRPRGWVSYRDWGNDPEVTPFNSLLRGGEEGNTLKHLLEAACNSHQKKKLVKTRVTTVFFYFAGPAAGGTGYVLKVQWITGRPAAATAYVRFNSSASFVGSMSASVILSQTPGGLDVFDTRDKTGQHQDGFHEITADPADCLIVSGYSDYPTRDDFLLVDVERFSQDNTADIVIGVVSPGRKLLGSGVWQVRRPLATPFGEVPLVLRKAAGDPEPDTALVAAHLHTWLATLDKLVANPALAGAPNAMAVERLAAIHHEVAARVPGGTFAFGQLAAAAAADEHRIYRVPTARDVILMLAKFE